MEPGDIVRSIRGRDSGRHMFILSRGEDGFLLLADGKLRHIEKPKRKKASHVAWVSHPEGVVPEKLRRGEKVNNSELRKLLGTLFPQSDAATKGGSWKCQKTI